MATRSRGYSTYTDQGEWKSTLGEIHNGTTKKVGYGNCTDIVGLDGDNFPFTVESWECAGGVLNGKGSGGRSFTNWIGDGVNAANFDHLTVAGMTADSAAAVQAAARSNPSRAYVDVPVECLQLGELIGLVKSLGGSILKRAARRNIEWQFAISPLLGDLVKLSNFHDQVDRRVKDIKRLAGPRGFRKTVKIDEKSSQATKSVVFQSENALLSGSCRGNTLSTCKAHVRWRATDSHFLKQGNPKLRKLALKAVGALNVFDAKSAWELLPWSWFMDWGFNISAYLGATRNVVPATLQNVTIMRHTKTTWECSKLSTGTGITMSPFKSVRETKTRRVAAVVPTAQFPFLSGNQLGIIGSLYVLKRT